MNSARFRKEKGMVRDAVQSEPVSPLFSLHAKQGI